VSSSSQRKEKEGRLPATPETAKTGKSYFGGAVEASTMLQSAQDR